MLKSPLKRVSGPAGTERTWRPTHLLAVFTLLLLAAGSGPVFAHKDSPASPSLVPSPLRLQNLKPAEVVALFARERLADGPGNRLPRAARTDEPESLLPYGVDAVLRGEESDEVVLVGTEGVADVRACIEVLDAPLQRTGPDREKIVLTLRLADASRLRGAVLRLPDAGSAAINGRQVTLEGSPAWLHRALRQVIRAELKQPESVGLPPP